MLVKNGREVKFQSPFESLAEMIDYLAGKQPGRTAIEFVDVDNDNRWKCSYGELKELVFGAAEMLRQKGLKAGDMISFGYHNHPNILILSLGAWVSGMRTAPLDLKRDDEEMVRYKLELSGAKVVFGSGSSLTSSSPPGKSINKVLHGSSSIVSKMLSSNLHVPLSAEALVLFTSGTTAKPKGALLTQENLVANADGIADWLNIKVSDRFMILLPLHHINSTTMSLATLLRGGTIVLVSRYSNSRFFEIAAETKSTLSSVVPTIIHDQLEQKNQFNILKSKLKLTRIQLGSAPVAAKEAEEFVKMTGIPLIQGYGQTETALRSTGVGFKDSLSRTVLGRTVLSRQYWRDLRSNTIGSEMKWTNVVVLKGEGSEGGRQAQEGEEGEICIRGPVIMKKYLKNQTATEEAFKYGWFHSGDLGYWKKVDGRKQFFLKGRIKEIIIKAGVNVSPMAVEEKILESVVGVDQVYVVGISDERVGEEVGVVAVWKEEGRRKRGIRETRVVKGLSEFETPRYWFSIPAEKLPMTSTGKVQRVKLKEMFGGCAAIAETKEYMFRVIAGAEENAIEAAREMYNDRWQPLSADKKNWSNELRDKFLIGAFEKETGKLGGWIRLKPDGKTILADAVTSYGKNNVYKGYNGYKINKKINKKAVEAYLEKKTDPIIEFHRRPKAGWKLGAKIVEVIRNARPGDTPALGYGVLMEYPKFVKNPTPKVTGGASLGTQLVEAGLVYAYKQGFSQVRVLSRPVGLWKWIRGDGLEGTEGQEGRGTRRI